MIRAAAVGIILVSLAGCATRPSDVPHTTSKKDLQEAARINAQLGLDYMRRGDLRLAEEKLKRAIAEDSSLVLAHTGLGLKLRDPKLRGRPKSRRAHFTTATIILVAVGIHAAACLVGGR